MKKYIHIKKEDRDFIAKVFGITGRSIYNALHFDDERGGSELAKKVRKLARERGGITMVAAPEEETLFDADGYMRQYLPGGVLLEFSLEDGSCVVYKHGEKVRRFDKVLVKDIPFIQDWASSLPKSTQLQPVMR